MTTDGGRLWGAVQVSLCVLSVLLGSVRPSCAQQRGRPSIESSLGYNRILSDDNTLLRGVSLSFDGGDPYGSLSANMPSVESLESLKSDYGLNSVHLYLEGDSSENPNNTPGYNAALADTLVQRTRDAGLYLIMTIGNNGENGQIHSMDFSTDFWEFYGDRYKDETHVIYEAHNEPAFFTPNQWTIQDWNNQVTLYNSIRSVAPDTMVLLGSFMGFAGDPTFGANYLSSNGVDWSNAGFAHHGYESKAGIENAIDLMQQNISFPATLSTEFFPGDTEGQGYNSMYESKFNGWMQFQWLGADDEDLNDFRSKINAAGTVWTPDNPAATWPARGTLDMPPDGSVVGIYSRDNQMFLSASSSNGTNLRADVASYTGTQNDSFTIEHVGDRHVSLRASNGFYLSTTGENDTLTANRPTAGPTETFEFIRLQNGDVALRSVGGGGHLVKRASGINFFFPDGDSGREAAATFVLVDNFGAVPAPLVGDPFYGVPQPLPGVLQAEDFDLGGQGQSYNDADANNQGGKYRTLEGVDIENTSDAGGGYNVGWLANGEWLEYTVDIVADSTAQYVLTARVASPNSGGALSISSDGEDLTGSIAVPRTGGWQNWTDVSTMVTLDPGVQTLRMSTLTGTEFNINSYTMELGGDFDFDGDVDIADLALWQRGNAGEPDSASGLALWRSNFNLNPGSAADIAVLPEPTAAVLLAALLVPCLATRRPTPMCENRDYAKMKHVGRDHSAEALALWMAGDGVKAGP